MIFLEILKIIGIVIGCILAFVLAVLLILLFSPICYRGKLTHKGDLDAEVRVWHPYGIFNALVKFRESKLDYKVRVLWIPIGDEEYDAKQAAKKEKKAQKEARKEAKKREARRKKYLKKKAKEAEKRKKQQQALKNCESEKMKNASNSKNTSAKNNSDSKVDINSDKANNNSESDNKKSIFDRIKEMYNNTREKINGYLELLRKILTEVNDKHNQGALVHVLKMIGIPVKYFFNKKLKVYIKLGMEDPALTGEILGGAYAAAAIFGLNLVIEPDFENKVFELDAGFRGRVFIITILIWALKIYFNKDVKIVINKFI